MLGDVKLIKKIEMTKKATLDQGYDEFIFNCKARNLREYTIKFYDKTIRTIYKFIEPKSNTFSIYNGQCALYSEFRNNGIGWEINVKLPILKKCIELHSNQPYWEQNNYMTNKDLRNPKFFAEREAVCKQFGVLEEDIFLKK